MGNRMSLQEALMARIGTKRGRWPPYSNQSKWNTLKRTTKRRTPVFGPMHFSTRLRLSTVQTQTHFLSGSPFWMHTQLRLLSAWTCLALLIACTSTWTRCTKAYNVIQTFVLYLQSCVHPPYKQRMSCRAVTIHHFWQDSASPLSLMLFFASPVSSVSRSGTQATTSPTVSCWHGLSHAHTTWSASPFSTPHRRIFSQSCEMKSATVKINTKNSSVVWEEQYGEPSARKKTLCPPFHLWCSTSHVVFGCWRCGVKQPPPSFRFPGLMSMVGSSTTMDLCRWSGRRTVCSKKPSSCSPQSCPGAGAGLAAGHAAAGASRQATTAPSAASARSVRTGRRRSVNANDISTTATTMVLPVQTLMMIPTPAAVPAVMQKYESILLF